MEPLVSVCIATYRRPSELARLLDSLARLKRPGGVRFETLVVDNDAERSAFAVVREKQALLDPLHYFVEPEKNIAHARNRGVDNARGRWLMFIDDDEVADENWLDAYLSLFDQVECDGAFGPVIPELEAVGTAWLDIASFYTRPRQPTGSVVDRGARRTGNAMLRRILFEQRRFDPAYGNSGGESTKLFASMSAGGARFVWCDEARVVEYVPASRHRLGWLAQRAFRGGFVHDRQNRRPGGPDLAFALARSGAIIAGLALSAPIAAVRGRTPLVRVGLRICTQAGRLWSALGRSYHECGTKSR